MIVFCSQEKDDDEKKGNDVALSQADCWVQWLKQSKKRFPDLARLIQILLVFGTNSSVVERFLV